MGEMLKKISVEAGREATSITLQDLVQATVKFANLKTALEEAESLSTDLHFSAHSLTTLVGQMAKLLNDASISLTKAYQAANQSTTVQLESNPHDFPCELLYLPQGATEQCYN